MNSWNHLVLSCGIMTVLLLSSLGCGGNSSGSPGNQSALRARGLIRNANIAEIDRDEGTIVGIFIGVDESSPAFAASHNLLPLRFAAADASLMFDTLASLRVPEKNLTKLLNDQATKKNLRQQFAAIASQTKPEDTLIVMVAGHGVTDDSNAQLVLYDDYVPVTELLELIGAVPAAKRILWIDSCHSGQPGKPEFDVRADISRMASGGLAWISSADAEQASFEDDDLGHGVFTNCLCQILLDGQNKDFNGNGWLDFDELGEAIKKDVGAYLDGRGLTGVQDPQYGDVSWQGDKKLFPVRAPWDILVTEGVHHADVFAAFPPSEISSQSRLWIVVAPETVGGGYWPQLHCVLDPSQGPFYNGKLYLGEPNGNGIGDRFNIYLVEADPELDEKFSSLPASHPGVWDPPIRNLTVRAKCSIVRER